MKLNTIIAAVAAATAIAFTGCNKQEGAGTGAGASVSTAAIEQSFAPAEAALKDAAMKAVDAVKKGDHMAALKELQTLASNVKLTDDQKKAINDLVEQLKKAAVEAGKSAAEAGNKAMGDAQKALGK